MKKQKNELLWTLFPLLNSVAYINSGGSTMSQSDPSSQPVPKTVHPTAAIIKRCIEKRNALRLTTPFHRSEEGFRYVLDPKQKYSKGFNDAPCSPRTLVYPYNLLLYEPPIYVKTKKRRSLGGVYLGGTWMWTCPNMDKNDQI